MSTRSGTIYAKTFTPFAKNTKIHHTITNTSETTKKSQLYDADSSSDYSDCEEYSSTTKPKYEVNIDFDEASIAWRANKRRVGESWVYTKPVSKKRQNVVVSSTQTDSIASRIKLRTAGK